MHYKFLQLSKQLEILIPTLNLTICAKAVRQTVGEHGLTATCETKPVVLHLLIKHRVL